MAVKKTKPAAKKSKAPAKKSKTVAKKTTPKPKKAIIKTVETSASVEKFINGVKEEQKRKDSFAIVELMKKATGAEPKMWGGSIIGFGNKLYVSPNTGRAVDWFLVGFSPRKVPAGWRGRRSKCGVTKAKNLRPPGQAKTRRM